MNKFALTALSALMLLVSHPVLAQTADLPTAKRLGLVGEQYNGLIGAVESPVPPQLQTYITRINIGRMQHYESLARSTGQAIEAIQARAGQNFILVTPPGQYYRNARGEWVKQQ